MSDEVRVTAADFNGRSWDGCPFSAVPDWLAAAIATEDLVVHEEGHTDYCRWRVSASDEVAGPGDTIVRGPMGLLWVERHAR